jgi:hypothetical protein
MMTYVGIGSCPHAATLAELTEEWDQMVPVFIRDKNAQIIHYDPQFANPERAAFLDQYFNARSFTKMSENSWSLGPMTVTLHAKAIYHPEDDNILHEYAESAISTNTKLLIQEFTGTDLVLTAKKLFSQTTSRESFKSNVLVDMTYGTDCHCGTNMVKYKPLYTQEGNFINMLLYDESEIISYIGESTELNKLIKIYFMKKYLETVNMQVDYRRRLVGGTVLFPCDGYGDTSTPEQVMAYLQKKLRQLLHVFDSLGLMTRERWDTVELLFARYKIINVYDWNTKMRTLFD